MLTFHTILSKFEEKFSSIRERAITVSGHGNDFINFINEFFLCRKCYVWKVPSQCLIQSAMDKLLPK